MEMVIKEEEKKHHLSKFFLYLIVVNYIAEGLAETLPGVTWPMISRDLKFNIKLISILTLVSYIGAGIASVFITKLRRRIGTNYSLFFTNLVFIVGLLLFSFSKSFAIISIGMFAIGFAIGADEVNIDSYVIKAYDASWDSVVHGLTFIGPILITLTFGISSRYISSYKNIYVYTITIFVILNTILYVGKRHWEKRKLFLSKEIIERHSVSEKEKNIKISFFELIKQKNVLKAFACFFLANGISRTLTIYINSILVSQKSFSINLSTLATAIYFTMMLLGRLFFGFLVKRISIKTVIRLNAIMCIIAFGLFYIDMKNNLLVFALVGAIGFLTAPFIPLVSSDMKNVFDINWLSTILGYGVMIGLFAVSIVSAIISVTISMFSMNAIQVVLIILSLIFIVMHGSLHNGS